MNTEVARQELGQRIRDLIEEQNLTVRGFALMVDLNKDYIVDLEYARKSPSFETILKIAWGFGLTPSELLDGIGVPEGREKLAPSPEDKTDKGLQRGYVRYHSSHL